MLEIEIGEVEADLFAWGEDGNYAGELRGGGLEEWEELLGEADAGVVVCCQFFVEAFESLCG